MQSVRPARAAVVLQPMTELGIIIPGYDDPDELGELMDSEKSHVSVQNIMAPTAESEFVAPSLLPSWLTQLWPRHGKSVVNPNSDNNHLDRSQFESYFLKTRLSCVLRLQEDKTSGDSHPFSCRVSRSVLGARATNDNAAFFAQLQPVPRTLDSSAAEPAAGPLPIFVIVCDELLEDSIYLPSSWIKWQGVDVGTPIFVESIPLADHLYKNNVVQKILLAATKQQEANLPAAADSLASVLATGWHVLPNRCTYLLEDQLFEVTAAAANTCAFVFVPPRGTTISTQTKDSLLQIKWDRVKVFHAGLTASFRSSSICPVLHRTQLTACLKYLSHCLRLDNNSCARPGHILVTGEAGVGKTTFLQCLASQLADSPHAVVSRMLNCVLLKGKRPDVIRKKIEEAVGELRWRRPALLVLDGLDSIVPDMEGPEVGEGLTAGASLATSLSELLARLTDEEAGLAVAASSTSVASLHIELLPRKGSAPFLKTEILQNPNREERRQLIETFLERSFPELSDDFLRATESFTVGDLERFARRLRAKYGANNSDLNMGMLLKEIHTFTPLARWSRPLRPEVQKNLSDVGALSVAKTALLETLVWPTTYEAIYKAVGVRMPRGVLLYGVPGTGKTLLAESVASTSGLNYIPVKGPELLSKYIGASEANVRDVFQRAAAARPCLVFFDEFESLAPRRGHDSTGVTDRVVNQLLTQLDGVEGLAEGVWVLAATSRPDLVDPALLRPGRLDKSILCPMPGEQDRLDILRLVFKKCV